MWLRRLYVYRSVLRERINCETSKTNIEMQKLNQVDEHRTHTNKHKVREQKRTEHHQRSLYTHALTHNVVCSHRFLFLVAAMLKIHLNISLTPKMSVRKNNKQYFNLCLLFSTAPPLLSPPSPSTSLHSSLSVFSPVNLFSALNG